MYEIISGAAAMGCTVISLFFAKFWNRTRDRLFLYFAISFLIEGCSRAILATQSVSGQLPYIARLAAYLFIVLGILEKNRRSKP